MHRTHLDAAGHPRPQLVREPDWRDLSGPWQFTYDDADRGRTARWMDPGAADAFTGTITVPYPPESKASGVHDTGFHPVLWYRRTLDVPRPAAGRRLLLRTGTGCAAASITAGSRTCTANWASRRTRQRAGGTPWSRTGSS